MNDPHAIRFLLGKFDKSPAKIAEALGIKNPQNVIHWRARGRISPAWRFKAFELLNSLGADLPVSWLAVKAKARAATKAKKGKANGRTRHAATRQRNRKRQKPKGRKATPRKSRGQGSQRAAVV
jgi:hypothetical protein